MYVELIGFVAPTFPASSVDICPLTVLALVLFNYVEDFWSEAWFFYIKDIG